MLLGQIGMDVNSGTQRFTMNFSFLADGVGLVSVALGCFGIAEITKNLDTAMSARLQRKDQSHPYLGESGASFPALYAAA